MRFYVGWKIAVFLRAINFISFTTVSSMTTKILFSFIYLKFDLLYSFFYVHLNIL